MHKRTPKGPYRKSNLYIYSGNGGLIDSQKRSQIYLFLSDFYRSQKRMSIASRIRAFDLEHGHKMSDYDALDRSATMAWLLFQVFNLKT